MLPFASVSVPEVCKHGAIAVPWNLPATWEKRNTANTAAVTTEGRADLITHYHVLPCYQLHSSYPSMGWSLWTAWKWRFLHLLQKMQKSRARSLKRRWTWCGSMRGVACTKIVLLFHVLWSHYNLWPHYQDYKKIDIIAWQLKMESRSWETCLGTKNEVINTD